MVKITKLDLEEVLVLEYDSKEDNRGTSHKLFSKKELDEVGIKTEFVEEILYCPKKKGTLYGIHFQNYPKAQTKLLFCTNGRGLDFAVDNLMFLILFFRKMIRTLRLWTNVIVIYS